MNLASPRTYTDKIGWLKVFDAFPLKTKCADKILVHEYSKSKLGKDICVPILKIYDDPADIDLSELPDKFVVKCNHGSAWNIICKDKASFDKQAAVRKLVEWLGTDYAKRGGEIHYNRIPRKCFAEKFMPFTTEYQFLCFNGKAKFCQVISDRFGKDVANNFYDMDFNFIDICNLHFPNNPKKEDIRPAEFD